jgi:tetratricopeptide (TPR) repeat protein
MSDIEITNENLDSVITTAYIYINQGQIKEALHIYNKIAEKFPDNPEVKHILEEITKRQKL